MSKQALERQIRPIYDALDTGSNKLALGSCNKFLKKNPTNTLVKALKTLALVRLQKYEEAVTLCDEVLAAKSTDDGTLSAMMHVLRTLGRHADMVTMFDHAFKQQPANEDIGAQSFFANVRTGRWKEAQQVATKLHKAFREDRYLYWSVMTSILQANGPATPPDMRALLYKLAHRIVGTSPTPSYKDPDRFYLHLVILRDLKLFDEARTLLDSDVGKSICCTSLVCDEIRREIWQLCGLIEKEAEQAEKRIIDRKDRNWLEFSAIIDAACMDAGKSGSPTNCHEQPDYSKRIQKARELLMRIAEEDGLKDRSGPLALLELEKRIRAKGMPTGRNDLVHLMQAYFQKFGDKACCFEDLRPYLELDSDGLARWTDFLDTIPHEFSTPADVQRRINVNKLSRYHLPRSALSPEMEMQKALLYVQEYLQGLLCGKDLPTSELQPADDLATLAAHAFVSLWTVTQDEKHLISAAAVLEFGLTKSMHAFQMRLMLVQIYRLLGAPSLALDNYRLLNVKLIQNETLSHFILSRASTFSLAAIGDLTYSSECLEASQIYVSNTQETSEFVVRAFTSEKYSQIRDFITFEDRLDNSLQRDLIKIEHVRMRIAHEQVNADLVDMELIELKFLFDRAHYDNRDMKILLNYQPRIQGSFDEQTTLFGQHPGLGWLLMFLKVYIKIFQQASDLDDTAEDKLLVGDRPKPVNESEQNMPLKERLEVRKKEELDQLTESERDFADFAIALADWLKPYHDYLRPPASTVLAAATKQGEPKTAQRTKKPSDSAIGNGSAKKDVSEEKEKPKQVPPVTEAPDILGQFFDGMKTRFTEAVASNKLIPEILHIASLTQEALIFSSILSIRLRPPAVVKVHKLGPIVQSMKNLRAQGVATLKDMSAALLALAGQEGSMYTPRMDGVKAIIESGIDREFVRSVVKNVGEARKKMLEGMVKGIEKICISHA